MDSARRGHFTRAAARHAGPQSHDTYFPSEPGHPRLRRQKNLFEVLEFKTDALAEYLEHPGTRCHTHQQH